MIPDPLSTTTAAALSLSLSRSGAAGSGHPRRWGRAALVPDGGIASRKPPVLVTKRIDPEAVEFLRQHCEVDSEATGEGLAPAEPGRRAAGKKAIVCVR